MKSYFDQVLGLDKFKKGKSGEEMKTMVKKLLKFQFQPAFDEVDLKKLTESIVFLYYTTNTPSNLKYPKELFKCSNNKMIQKLLHHPFMRLAKYLISTKPNLYELFHHELVVKKMTTDPEAYMAEVQKILDKIGD